MIFDMLLILAMLYAASPGIQAIPAIFQPFNSTSQLLAAPYSQPGNSLCTEHRSVWDIVRSCFTTIFLCTWTAIHPNMPGRQEGKVRITFRRVELAIWAIIAPEAMLFWALRQWSGARSIACMYNGNSTQFYRGFVV